MAQTTAQETLTNMMAGAPDTHPMVIACNQLIKNVEAIESLFGSDGHSDLAAINRTLQSVLSGKETVSRGGQYVWVFDGTVAIKKVR